MGRRHYGNIWGVLEGNGNIFDHISLYACMKISKNKNLNVF